MAKFRYFSDATELSEASIHWDGRKQYGQPASFVREWNGSCWTKDYRPVTRVVRLKDRPSLHICDARCMNATGRNMSCECSCGGKNHGAGAFACAEAA